MTVSLALPERYLITPEPPADGDFEPFLARLDAAVTGGVALVQLRAKTLDAEAWRALAGEALRRCRSHGARLIANPPGCAAAFEVEADGVHWSSARLMAGDAARPVAGTGRLVSAACHSLDQLQRAAALGVDFVTLSPVLPTATHPEASPLGWARFAELVAASAVPVYALGGLRVEHLAQAKAAGAQGIAAIRGLWSGEGGAG